MKLKLTTFIITTIIAFILIGFYQEDRQSKHFDNILKEQKVKKEYKQKTAQERAAWEFMRLRDPKTNRIPENIRQKELAFATTLPKHQETVLFKGNSVQNTQAISWQERGPNNLGGRTRAFAADKRNANIVIAAGISGGIWRSTNGGINSWTMVTSKTDFPPVSCIAQDPRSGNEDTWYAGTGEQEGNSASARGATYFGNGIYKSTDNGVTWSLLSSTVGNVYTWDNDWEYVNSIVVSPTTGSIFAAANSSIRKSTDGGANWSVVKGDLNNLSRSEVAVNSAGVVFASISSQGTNGANPEKGIWKSTDDGANWTNITPVAGTNSTTSFPSDYRRVVLATAPSNNNILYIYGYTPGAGKTKSSTTGSSVWKYDASQTGTNQWVDRSPNLPDYSANVAGMDTQGGYNMLLIVKPDNANFVIIGSTNLYRTTDGFATKIPNTSANWIGGYSVADDISSYANHHPDNHSGFFQPGNSTVFYSGHDGGLSKTTDVTATPVVWSDIDQGYNVAQFYTISLAPENNGTYMAGGAQDNGVRFTTAAGLSNWTEFQGGGDGAFVDVAPSGDDIVYTEVQNGSIDRFTRNNTYLGSITPSGSTNPLFVNPFILDPNSSSLLYYGAGNSSSTSGIWRNNDAKNSTTTTGWSSITTINITNDGQVSAIDVSYTNSANVLYFGTSLGKMYKITNANTTGSVTPTSISSGLPSNGYVSSVSIDPTNSNNVMIAYSNYSFNSIYYTSDGGSSWTFVEGNLNAAAGPSVRSCEIFQVDGVTHYFVGTSIGLYYTLTLNGTSTVWTQEATSSIGNLVCDFLDWRSDAGTIAKTSSPNGIQAVSAVSLAVGTHGRGAYQGTLQNPLPVELTTFAGVFNGNAIELKWETATEVNNYGFEIERKISLNGTWEKIGFVSGSGNSNSPHNYSYADNNLVGGTKFYYRLKQIDIDGHYEYSNEVEVNIIIKGFKLAQNYPNPFNPSTRIKYSIPENAHVKIDVYSVTGELVAHLVNKEQGQGNYTIDFNSTDFNNLSSGMYLYRILAEGVSGSNYVKTNKMLLLK